MPLDFPKNYPNCFGDEDAFGSCRECPFETECKEEIDSKLDKDNKAGRAAFDRLN